jgi:hypothetical protein
MVGRNGLMKEHRKGRGRFAGAREAWRTVVIRARRGAVPCLVGLALSLNGAVAWGSEPTNEDRSTARELALEGYEALRSRDYALASDRFKRADALVHAPTLLLDLGRAYLGLGQLVNAHETFQQIIREGVPADAPPTWRRALSAAQKEDAAVKPRLAWITINAEGAEAPRVKLDEEELATASLGVRRAVDPGHRTVVAEAEGFLPASGSVDLVEGQLGEIHLLLKRDPSYVPPSTPAPDGPKRVIVIERPSQNQRTLAYVALGVSGAGLLLSGVTTALMLRARSKLEPECDASHCPPTAAGDVSSYRTYGTLAAVGLGVGLAGAGVGTYFWLSRPATDDKPRQSVRVLVSPSYVGMSGRF